MIKYVLFNANASFHYSNEIPSAIATRLALLESQGVSLDDLYVTEIDTNNYPPKKQTAKSFLKSIEEDAGSKGNKSPDK